jgi:ABC-type multidrug transport system ATPase subunit
VSARGDLVATGVGCRLRPGRSILTGVSATFPAGEVTAIVGSNGSGKSTFARILAGIDRPSAGQVTRPSGRVVFVPERAPALAGCSARALAHALRSRAEARGAVDRRLAAALEAMGYSHAATTSLGRLSKGNLQKAHLAVAYAVRPTVAILDEPATGLDVAARTAANDILRQVADDGAVVVVTAHTEASAADRNLRLEQGGLIASLDAAGRSYRVVLETAGEPDHRVVVVPREQLGAFVVAAMDRGDVVSRVEPA